MFRCKSTFCLKTKTIKNQQVMKTKIRRISDWKTWKTTTSRHNTEVLLTHIAVIVGVFIIAAML
jgi:hypothetical protein